MNELKLKLFYTVVIKFVQGYIYIFPVIFFIEVWIPVCMYIRNRKFISNEFIIYDFVIYTFQIY